MTLKMRNVAKSDWTRVLFITVLSGLENRCRFRNAQRNTEGVECISEQQLLQEERIVLECLAPRRIEQVRKGGLPPLLELVMLTQQRG